MTGEVGFLNRTGLEVGYKEIGTILLKKWKHTASAQLCSGCRNLQFNPLVRKGTCVPEYLYLIYHL